MSRAPAPLSMPLFPQASPLVDASAPGIALRDYQTAVIARLRAHTVGPNKKKRMLLVAPCASGKMVMAAAMIRTSVGAVAFVAHRRELLDQCVTQLARYGVRHVSVIRGDDERYDPHCAVQIASIDSLRNRSLGEPRVILIDEAHRSMADSYVEHVFDKYPNAVIIGLTATPSRLDNQPLGVRYEVMEQATSFLELLKGGHLLEPTIYGAPIVADLSGVRMMATGDYNDDELAEIMSAQALRGQLVTQWLRLAHLHRNPKTNALEPGPRRRTVVFAVNVEHSKKIAADFRAAGVCAEHLDGETPGSERARILTGLESGAIELVSNVDVLTEGVDIPAIKCIAHARPTASLVHWIQSCSRAGRLFEGITPIILDHAGNSERHGSPVEDRQWSLTHAPSRFKAATDAPTRTCPKCFLVNAAGRYLCAGCLFEFPKRAPVKKDLPTETEEELVALGRSDLQRAFWAKMFAKARAKGFRPGYPSAKFKEKYGFWPPYEWKEEADAIYAFDPHWQELVAKRSREAAYWAGKNEPAEAPETEAGDFSNLSDPFFDDPLPVSEPVDQTFETATVSEPVDAMVDTQHATGTEPVDSLAVENPLGTDFADWLDDTLG